MPQDPADEPASELLARIRGERRRLVAKGELKFPKCGESATTGSMAAAKKRVDAKGGEGEPRLHRGRGAVRDTRGWEWARLGTLATFTGGGTPDKGIPLIGMARFHGRP